MTSITLISPVNQASKYNVRFRDGIKINKNSKVYLNYASFTRLNNARFNGNQNLNLNSNFIVPTHRLDDTTLTNDLNLTTSINTFDNELNEFVLSPKELETRLNSSLNLMCVNQLKNYKSYDIQAHVLDFETQKTEHYLGLVYKRLTPLAHELNLNVSHGYSQVVAGNEVRKSTATAAQPFYDNYSISNLPVYPFQLGNNNLNDYKPEMKEFIFEPSERLTGLDGKVSCGLLSVNMMEHLNAFTGWPHKTRGTATHNGNFCNPAIFRSAEGVQLKDNDADFDAVKTAAILGSFLTVEVDGINESFNIYLPKNASGNTPKDWTNMNQNIVGMKNIFTHDYSGDNTLITAFVRLSIQFYNDLGNSTHLTNNFKVFFKVFIKDLDEDDATYILLYDSFTTDDYFPKSFFTGLDVNEAGLTLAQRQARIKAQSPFNVIVSATEQAEGATVKVDNFTMDGATDKPTSILLDYNLSFSSEIANILDTSKTQDLFPNTEDSLNTQIKIFTYSDFRSILNGLSYDIFLNNLPIKNYKNKENNSDGGFIKQIVATCPLPFNQNNTTSINRGRIIGLYEPNNIVKLALDNQEITLNNIDVEIKTSHDERPAFELEKAMINIIIED